MAIPFRNDLARRRDRYLYELIATSISRQLDDDDIRVFIERQSVPKLDVHPVEGMTVFTALEAIVEAAIDYDPFLSSSILND